MNSLLLGGSRRKPVQGIKKGQKGVYWSTTGSQYYRYDGTSDQVKILFIGVQVPRTSLKKKLYRLTEKELEIHIKIRERELTQITNEIEILKENIPLTRKK